MKVLAPAKVNLFLEITRLRPDRYHEIETIFQTVSLYDRLEIKKISQNPGSVRLEVTGELAGRGLCPAGPSNIVYKAADLFLKEFDVKAAVQIKLEKVIPIQAGLGGGSSDAAAVLKGLSRLFCKKNPHFERRLRKIALSCGADVPFFLGGGCALAQGVGEKIKSIPQRPRFWAVLIKPPVGCPTKEVYGWLDDARGWGNGASGTVRARLTNRVGIHKIARLIRRKKSVRDWGKHLYNAFEAVVFQKYPQIAETKRFLLSNGAYAAGLSGSGSAVFGLVSSRKRGEQICRNWDPSLGRAWVVRSL